VERILARGIESGALFALLHFALGLRICWDPRNIHDEGLSTYGFSRLLGEAFIPGLFFQRIRPALALAYFLPSRLGLDVFLITHLALGSVAVLLVARVARALGQQRPWLAALCLGLSPLYLWCNATGISNSSGVAVAILSLYVLEVRKLPFAAGFLLGALPFVRPEAAVFGAALAPYVIYRDRDFRFVLGLVIWPAVYLGAGAFYHADPLWFVHFGADVPRLDPAVHAQEIEMVGRHGLGSALAAVLSVSPALLLLVFARPSRFLGVERALLAFTVLYAGIFFASHLGPLSLGLLHSVGFSSRNLLLVAAAVPLLVGRLLERHARDSPPRLRLAVVATVVLICAGPLLAAPSMTAEGYSLVGLRQHGRLQELTETLAQLGEVARRRDVYTNSKMLAPYLERTNLLPGARVRYMLPADIFITLNSMTNPNNGQRDALLEALPRATFGAVVLPGDLDTERVPDGTLFLNIEDERTDMILPPARWAPHLYPLAHAPFVELAMFCRSTDRSAAPVAGDSVPGGSLDCPAVRP
jgi:hypothetical protein